MDKSEQVPVSRLIDAVSKTDAGEISANMLYASTGALKADYLPMQPANLSGGINTIMINAAINGSCL